MKLTGSPRLVSRRFRLWYYCWASQYDRRKTSHHSSRNLNHQQHNAAILKIQNSNATSKLYLSFPTTSTSIMGQNKMVPVQKLYGQNVLKISSQQHNGTKVCWKIRIQMWLKNMLGESLKLTRNTMVWMLFGHSKFKYYDFKKMWPHYNSRLTTTSSMTQNDFLKSMRLQMQDGSIMLKRLASWLFDNCKIISLKPVIYLLLKIWLNA
jgi:hypothetical protein